MRTILYKSGFLRYFSSLLEYCQTGKRKRAYVSVYIVYVFLSLFLDQTTWTWLSAVMLAFIGAYLGSLRNAKPNVVTLAPISWKQKTVYSFLSTILYFVVAVAVMILLRVFFLCISSVYGLLIGADVSLVWKYSFQFNPYDFAIDGIENSAGFYEGMGLYGILFGIIFELACYSAGMFAAYIKKGGYKAIFVFAFCLAISLCLQFMSLPYSLTLEKGVRFVGFFIGSPFYNVCYEYMQYAWLSVTLCGIAALAFFGVTVWFVARRNRGKDY